MTNPLDDILENLRAHESGLRRLAVSHAVVFGSVARGEATAASDVDVLVVLDERQPIGIFEYAGIKLYINEILEGAGGRVASAPFLKFSQHPPPTRPDGSRR